VPRLSLDDRAQPTRSRGWVGRHAHAGFERPLRIGARGLRSSWASPSRENFVPAVQPSLPMDLSLRHHSPRRPGGPRNGRSLSNWRALRWGVSAVVIFCLTVGFAGCTVIEPTAGTSPTARVAADVTFRRNIPNAIFGEMLPLDAGGRPRRWAEHRYDAKSGWTSAADGPGPQRTRASRAQLLGANWETLDVCTAEPPRTRSISIC